jgi:phage terminase large subunit-like protein
LFHEQLLIHSAHQVQTALDGFRRIRAYFENYDDLGKLVLRIRESHTEQGIELKSGQRLRFMARSKSSGRGFSAACLLLDEAQELSDDTWAAMLPTISAQDNPQVWLLGTPPSEQMNGEVFSRFHAAGLEGKERHLAWFGWSAEPGSDLDSQESWAQANPALHIRIDPERITAERVAMDDETFARERLGMWSGAAGMAVIDAVTWGRAGDMMSQPDDRLALAVDVNPDRSAGSIALAGLRADGKWHVELVDTRNSVGWIPDKVAGICQRQGIRAVVVDAGSAAASLIEPLEARKVAVTRTNWRQMAQACGAFYDATVEDGLRHIDQPQMNVAVSVARKRSLGDAWAWHRKNATSDITPLVAATLALYGAQSDSVATAKKPSMSYAF